MVPWVQTASDFWGRLKKVENLSMVTGNATRGFLWMVSMVAPSKFLDFYEIRATT
jgi:hypothetical protein